MLSPSGQDLTILQGDCIVLVLLHPGQNMLGRFFPPEKINDLLMGTKPSEERMMDSDVRMSGPDPEIDDVQETFDVMDIASFLEFAIQATHCLEVIHRCMSSNNAMNVDLTLTTIGPG